MSWNMSLLCVIMLHHLSVSFVVLQLVMRWCHLGQRDNWISGS
jgi:hypothetical protein